MGLDMYLSKKTYIKNWDHMKPEEKHKISIKGPKSALIKINRVSEIKEDVMYWRKANQIHRWFVDNVQGGEDDCKEYHVRGEQLEELLALIKKVLMYKPSKEKAEELLPNQAGFFFGSEEYDDYYWEDLETTKVDLEKLLAEPEGKESDYTYQSSW